MAQEIRIRLDDEAYAILKEVCEAQHLKPAQALSAIIRQFRAPSGEADTKLDVVLLQLQRVQAMLEELLNEQARGREAPAETTVPIATEADLYGPIVRQPMPAEDQIPEAFRLPQPKRGLLNRLLYKEEE